MESKLISQNWVHLNLYELCKKITDGTHETPMKTNEGVPFITAIHVKPGFIDFRNCYYVSREDHEVIYRRCNPEKGDILFVNIGVGTASPAFINVDFEFSLKNVALLKPNNEKIYGKFLEELLLYKRPHLYYFFSTGGAQPFISLKEIGKIDLIIPPLPEQRKIAEILSTWDKAIVKTEQLIEALRQRKKGLMQRLLTGQVRFPGFEGEWKEASLKNIATLIMGQSPSSSAYNKNKIGLPLIQGNADILNKKTNPKLYTSEITKQCEVGDIILGVRAPVGETALSYHKACIGRGVCAIRATKADSKFLYHLLVYNEFRWQKFAQGSTFTAINSSDIREFILVIPPSTQEQTKIAKFIDYCDKEIDLFNKYLGHLQQQKKGLMQRLLTGQVRVKVE